MDRGTTEGALLIELGGRSVEYRFARRRRRTLGITVDAAGLRVAAPLRAPWREIEAFLRDKERWILRKLDEWAATPRGAALEGMSGEALPLFGTPYVLEVGKGRRSVEARFWALLEQLYPGWREARERLELANATLPLLKGKR